MHRVCIGLLPERATGKLKITWTDHMKRCKAALFIRELFLATEALHDRIFHDQVLTIESSFMTESSTHKEVFINESLTIKFSHYRESSRPEPLTT